MSYPHSPRLLPYVVGVVLLTVFLLSQRCSREPDLHLASNEELIKLIAKMQKGEPHDSLGNRAAGELASRPRKVVASELRSLLQTGDSNMRCTTAHLLGEFLADTTESRLEADARKETETSLLALLDQPDERVRASTLFGLGHGWSLTRPDSVPEPVAASIRDLIQSEVAEARFQASLAAFWTGPAVDSVAEVLTTRLRTEPESSVRFALACALGRVGAKYAPAGAALVGLLDDAEEDVRFAAAGSLGDRPQVAADAISRLRRCLADESEATGVRRAAAESLVKLVTSPADVEAVLLGVLDSHSVFASYQEQRWLAALGKLGARAPNTDAARAARERLEAAAQSETDNDALVAASSLARIACAERDRGLGERVAVSLLGALPTALSVAQDYPSRWSAEDDTYEPIMESLVDLALWPEMQVDALKLRPVFEELLKRPEWWIREWAGEQLGRLE
ncbi:MAG TPA: HEAT repeat domain-containing protein [Planctomycetota bacterium]|nr:HEAT repeat domain-containing protein [Planctomycetota bacterium]